MEVVHILLQDFTQHLTSQNASDSTIKNYLADIGLFFRFLENRDQPVSLLTLPHQLSDPTISSYHQYLIAHFPSSTVKRRVSSLNKFISFTKLGKVLPTNLVTNNQPTSSSLPLPLSPPPHAKVGFNYPFALFILLTVSLSIIGGFVASQLTPSAPIGLVDPSTTPLLP